MVGIWVIGGVLVLLLGIAVVVDLKDRGRGGERRIRFPGRAARLRDVQNAFMPVDMRSAETRARTPREEEERLRREQNR